MAVDSKAKCRLCRREGKKLFLKGEKCFSPKCSFDKRNGVAPGQHGQKRGRLTDYGIMLREKQSLRRIYGILEKQFHKHYEEAERRKGPTGSLLLQILESRLDNLVYRMGFALSRAEARQLISHKSIAVNEITVNIPSYEVKVGDKVKLVDKSQEQLRVGTAIASATERGLPEWLEVDSKALAGTYKLLPQREDLSADIQEHLVVELYSK